MTADDRRRAPATSPLENCRHQLTRKDFVSDQEVRWCPGCGDYSILAQTQKVMPDFGYAKENIVFISGIGCSGRLPYYMNTYGFHTIHGRAPTIATGLKARPPGPHGLGHHRRRRCAVDRRQPPHPLDAPQRRHQPDHVQQPDLRPDQGPGVARRPSSASAPSRRPWARSTTRSCPLAIALAAEASFVARSVDTHTEHLQKTLERAGRHRGSVFVEVLQNCNIFNDGACRDFTDREVRDDRMLVLEHGKPMIFGEERNRGIRLNGHHPEIVTIGEDGVTEADLLVHDEDDPLLAAMLSTIYWPDFPVPVGVIRSVQRPTHSELLNQQVEDAVTKRGRGNLTDLLDSGETWIVTGEAS